MKTLQIFKPLIFLVPSAFLIGFGLWSVVMNVVNYQESVSLINNSNGICDGKRCYCTNIRCITVDDLNYRYFGDFELPIGLLSAGGTVIVISRKWWK